LKKKLITILLQLCLLSDAFLKIQKPFTIL